MALNSLTLINMDIIFKEHPIWGYKARTIENAKADVTIAIAKDFTTAGEKLTAWAGIMNGKPVIPIPWDTKESDTLHAESIIKRLKKFESLNIAGNGIYTLNMAQSVVDVKIYILLDFIFQHVGKKPNLIISGGQTGVDEAGLKAAIKLGIPALCLAPKGWTFRDINGKDISDEKLFKARFQ